MPIHERKTQAPKRRVEGQEGRGGGEPGPTSRCQEFPASRTVCAELPPLSKAEMLERRSFPPLTALVMEALKEALDEMAAEAEGGEGEGCRTERGRSAEVSEAADP